MLIKLCDIGLLQTYNYLQANGQNSSALQIFGRFMSNRFFPFLLPVKIKDGKTEPSNQQL